LDTVGIAKRLQISRQHVVRKRFLYRRRFCRPFSDFVRDLEKCKQIPTHPAFGDLMNTVPAPVDGELAVREHCPPVPAENTLLIDWHWPC
jgi:hypothetical protein